MGFLNKIKQEMFAGKWWISWTMMIVGAFILASGFVFFMRPYQIVPGGVSSLGMIMNHIFPSIEMGTFAMMFDIPLMLIGFRVFGGGFGAKTVIAAFLSPLFMNLLSYLVPGQNPAEMFGGVMDFSNDMIMVCVFGGALVGAGVGLVIRAGATTGGTDIVALLMQKYLGIGFARSLFIADASIVILGIIVFGDWKLPMYSLVTIFVSTKVVDFVIDGASYDKLLFIISDKHSELESFILEDMERGATYIKSSGMYTRKDKDMVFLVVSRREVNAVQAKIKEIDPHSFVVVVTAHETYGDGFKSFAEYKG